MGINVQNMFGEQFVETFHTHPPNQSSSDPGVLACSSPKLLVNRHYDIICPLKHDNEPNN